MDHCYKPTMAVRPTGQFQRTNLLKQRMANALQHEAARIPAVVRAGVRASAQEEEVQGTLPLPHTLQATCEASGMVTDIGAIDPADEAPCTVPHIGAIVTAQEPPRGVADVITIQPEEQPASGIPHVRPVKAEQQASRIVAQVAAVHPCHEPAGCITEVLRCRRKGHQDKGHQPHAKSDVHGAAENRMHGGPGRDGM